MVDVRFREVVIDCADPPSLAGWWADFTGYAARTTEDDWSTIESPEETMIIGFQKVPEGKVVKSATTRRIFSSSSPSRREMSSAWRVSRKLYCVAIFKRVRISRCAS